MKVKNIKFPASYSIKFSPDGKIVVSLGKSIYFASVGGMKRIGKCHPFSHPSSFDFSPSGANIAVKSTSGEIAIINCSAMEVFNSLGGKADGEGCDLHYSPCGDFLISGSWSGCLKILKIDSGVSKYYGYEGQMIKSLSCSKNRAKWMLVRNTKHPLQVKYFVEVWNWPFESCVPSVIEFSDLTVDGAAISPSGEMAALASHSKLLVYSFEERRVIASFKRDGGGTGTSVFWFSDNQRIAFNTSYGFSIVSLSQSGNELVLLHKYPASFNYSTELKLLAISTWENGVVEHSESFI